MDPYQPASQEVAEQGLAPYQGIDVHVIGGAGGRGSQTGDFFYGDNRRAFTESGMCGIIRVLPKKSCTATTPVRRLDGAACGEAEPIQLPSSEPGDNGIVTARRVSAGPTARWRLPKDLSL